MKKVSYINVLKESLQEADTTKTSDILGPMVEPILGYNGNGELKTHKNVADILNKYYYEIENNDGLINVNKSSMSSTTKGELDQKKINNVKKKVGDIISNTTQTDKPTEKVLDEMVTSLEEILLDEGDGEIDDLEDAQGNNDNEIDDASKDVIIDKDTKTKLESILLDEGKKDCDDGDGDEAIETKDDEEDLNVDKEVSESEIFGVSSELEKLLESDDNYNNSEIDEIEKLLESEDNYNNSEIDEIEKLLEENVSEESEDIIESVLRESSMSEDERIIDNLEVILEQGDIGSFELTDNEVTDEDIDDSVVSKVTTESIEDSVLEWLIMEIEDKDLLEDDNSFDSDDLENFDDDFNIASINSDEIRV